MVATSIKAPNDDARYAITLGLLESASSVPGGVVVSVPAWVLHEIRQTLSGDDEPPPPPSTPLSTLERGNLGRMLSPNYVSDLEKECADETALRLAARAMLESIAVRCLAGQTDSQILAAARCSDELRRLVTAVRLAQEEWTW
jgi:hypothetical protein